MLFLDFGFFVELFVDLLDFAFLFLSHECNHSHKHQNRGQRNTQTKSNGKPKNDFPWERTTTLIKRNRNRKGSRSAYGPGVVLFKKRNNLIEKKRRRSRWNLIAKLFVLLDLNLSRKKFCWLWTIVSYQINDGSFLSWTIIDEKRNSAVDGNTTSDVEILAVLAVNNKNDVPISTLVVIAQNDGASIDHNLVVVFDSVGRFVGEYPDPISGEKEARNVVEIRINNGWKFSAIQTVGDRIVADLGDRAIVWSIEVIWFYFQSVSSPNILLIKGGEDLIVQKVAVGVSDHCMVEIGRSCCVCWWGGIIIIVHIIKDHIPFPGVIRVEICIKRSKQSSLDFWEYIHNSISITITKNNGGVLFEEICLSLFFFLNKWKIKKMKKLLQPILLLDLVHSC